MGHSGKHDRPGPMELHEGQVWGMRPNTQKNHSARKYRPCQVISSKKKDNAGSREKVIETQMEVKWVVKKGLSEKMTFEQRPGGSEGEARWTCVGRAEGTASAKA